MRTLLGHYQDVRENTNNKKGSKRSAKSEAEEEGSGETDVRIYQPPAKRTKEDTQSH